MTVANTSAPTGFLPFARLPGGAPNFQLTTRKIASGNGTAIYKGDVVVSLNTGYITAASSNSTQVAGIFWGCKYYSVANKVTIWRPYWPGSDASGDVEAYIIADPQAEFIVQSGNGGPVTFASVNSNIGFNAGGGGSTTTGVSGMYADYSTIATTNTLPFRIVALASDYLNLNQNGTDNTTQYNSIIVAFNNQDFKSLTGI